MQFYLFLVEDISNPQHIPKTRVDSFYFLLLEGDLSDIYCIVFEQRLSGLGGQHIHSHKLLTVLFDLGAGEAFAEQLFLFWLFEGDCDVSLLVYELDHILEVFEIGEIPGNAQLCEDGFMVRKKG